jgi:acyl-CoA reductase-like NAD-dependent aldehyde dehydrogenase
MDALEISEEHEGFTVVREPIGVVVAITPWNFPLHQIVAKIAPAIAAGCTVVVKPAELSSLSAIALFEVIHDSGLPVGVANLICGSGPVVGEALAAHPSVDMVSFTGSTRSGARVGELAIKDIKKVALELGGKSATIILEDAALDKAVSVSLSSAFTNNGQMCSALSRLIVLRSQLEKVEELLSAAIVKQVLGDPFENGVRVGPMVSAHQRDVVIGYIEKGIAEGATLLAGGPERPAGKGYFVKPTIFTNVSNEMVVAREEIFGPVLVVIPVDSEEEAISVANDSDYGLSGAVWGSDEEHAVEVAKKIRTGQVSINGGAFYADAPFGGYKKSGIGRELGSHGLEEFFELKAIRF